MRRWSRRRRGRRSVLGSRGGRGRRSGFWDRTDMAGNFGGADESDWQAGGDGSTESCLLLIVNPAHRGPVIEDPRMGPGVVGGVGGGEDADEEQGDCRGAAPAAVAEPIGGGEEREEPERREPDEPAEAAGAAAVVAVDLRAGEVEGEDDERGEQRDRGNERRARRRSRRECYPPRARVLRSATCTQPAALRSQMGVSENRP